MWKKTIFFALWSNICDYTWIKYITHWILSFLLLDRCWVTRRNFTGLAFGSSSKVFQLATQQLSISQNIKYQNSIVNYYLSKKFSSKIFFHMFTIIFQKNFSKEFSSKIIFHMFTIIFQYFFIIWQVSIIKINLQKIL